MRRSTPEVMGHDAALGAGVAALLGAVAATSATPVLQRLGYGPSLMPLLILAIAALVYLFHRRRESAVLRRADRLMRTHLGTIEALTLAIAAKDPHSQGHVRRVQAYALELAQRLHLPRRETEAIRFAALLHDIGKLAIPDHLLNKPGKLSEIEYQKVKVHPAVAVEILANVEFPYPVLPIVRHHHERWDGSGYPDGLKGEAIPHGARVLAVADAFEALTSDRVYRTRKSPEEACALMSAWAGIHYDPDIVAVLRDHLAAIGAAAERAARAPIAEAAGVGRSRAPAFQPGVAALWSTPESARDPSFQALLHRGVGAGGTWGDEAARDGSRGAGAAAAGAGEAVDGAAAEGPAAGAAGADVPAESEAGARGRAALEDISSAHREVYALYEIAQTLGSSLRLGEILDLVVSKIGQLIPYRTCAIYLLEDNSDMLSARFVSGASADALRGRALRLGEGITGWAAAEKSTRFSTSPELDLAGATLDPVQYSTIAAFPLIHDNKALGVISLYFAKGVPCLDDYVRMMEIIARLAAGAVFNSTIFAETQESALTDDVTRLPNSRYLRQIFEQEAIRSQQAGQPMAFLEMDLDDFKAVNDRLGHAVGDRYLAEAGRVLRSQLRERDVLVRLAGDEFGAILPLTGFAQAALLAERLQQAVDVFTLRLEEGKVARSGISVGIALYPQDGETFEDLLMRADYNMYQNKAARKSSRLALAPNIIPFPLKSPGGKG
jgi:diguanylate cyclase (GGDEF)-like protein/putative nucleotidyltransferase with HDIG domain